MFSKSKSPKVAQIGKDIKPNIYEEPNHYDGLTDYSGAQIDSLPDKFMTRGALDLCGCSNLKELPSGLNIGSWLDASWTVITSIPDDAKIRSDIICRGCDRLISLPTDFKVGGSLDLTGCENLTKTPNNMVIEGNLEMTGCVKLAFIGRCLRVGCSINLSDCKSIKHLPKDIYLGNNLILRGCEKLEEIPEHLCVNGDLDLTDCISIKYLPDSITVGGVILLSGCEGISLSRELYQGMKGRFILPNSFSLY